MKWLAVALIVINLAAYLLGSRQTPLDTVRSDSRSDVNKTGMLLLAEVDASQSAATVFSRQPDASGAASAQMPDEAATAVANPINDRIGQPVAAGCYRLGPFRQEDSWQAAKRWMDGSGFKFRAVTSGSRQLLAFRVYLGPFASESSVDAILKELESRGLEHFRYRTDNGLTRISMGVFSQEELAQKYLDYLKNNRYEARFQPEYRRLGPLNWIEISSTDMQKEQLSGHDWHEPGVALTKVNCRT